LSDGSARSAFATPEDLKLDRRLRPRTFDEFVGRTAIKENLRVYVRAARERGEPLDHILFSGSPGLGKTTLSHIVAREMGAELRATSGPVLERPIDLAGVLTKLEEGDVLFIDEVHRLSASVEEYLYGAMEDFRIDILIDSGPHARSVKIELPRFTLIGATTREGLLTGPFRSRFGILEKIDLYPPEELKEIALRSARLLTVEIDPPAAETIARRARGTPRVVNRFLARIRDFAQVEGDGSIRLETAEAGLKRLGVDEVGLDATDRAILRCLTDGGGGPMGLKTISVVVGETEDTIEDVYEPFLIRSGFVAKTPKGRVATPRAFEHLGISPEGGGEGRGGQSGLFS
jgi:Holliday junction DNA helicase RuvB